MVNKCNHSLFTVKVLLYLFFLSVPCFVQGQVSDYTISYDFVSINDTVDQVFGPTYPFLLINQQGVSRFHSEYCQFNDSMAVEWYNQHPQYVNPETFDESIASAQAFLAGSSSWMKSDPVNYRVEKDMAAKTGKIGLDLSMPPQFFTQSMDFDWVISDQRDTIAGLLCTKATTNYNGRNWEVWYTPTIPIPDGPYIFANLPGLIVKAQDSRGWFTFTLTGIDLSRSSRFWREDYLKQEPVEITQQDYVKANRRRMKNPSVPGVATEQASVYLQKARANLKWKIHLLLEN